MPPVAAPWRLVFSDDFTTDIPLGSFQSAPGWRSYPSPWRDTSRNGMYSPQLVVSVANGVLDKWLHTTPDGIPRVAAIQPMNAQNMLYGRYEIRARMDFIEGFKVAWLLWPQSGKKLPDGEIDFPERNLDSPYVWGFVHRQGATVHEDQAWFRITADATQWHTYVTEWTPNLVVFYIDGVEVGRTTERIPNTPMHWVIQTETRLYIGPPPPEVEGHIQIDWVKIWAWGT